MKIRLEGGLPFVTATLRYAGRELSLEQVLLDTVSGGSVFAADEVFRLGLLPEPEDPIQRVRGIGGTEYPFWFAENSTMHGIALHPLTMPGSGNPEVGVYGLTLAHEMGHYLGAYHTFQGGCADGDEVADTPAQASPTMTCSPGADTCAGGGADDVFNFMNYTPDTCMDHFTPGQVQRMIALTSAFRPNLVN